MWKVNDSPLGSNPADFSQGVNLGDSPPWRIPQGFSSFSSNLNLLLLVFKILACCQSPLPFPDSSLQSKMKVVQFQCCITVVRIVMIKVMIMSRGWLIKNHISDKFNSLLIKDFYMFVSHLLQPFHSHLHKSTNLAFCHTFLIMLEIKFCVESGNFPFNNIFAKFPPQTSLILWWNCKEKWFFGLS